MADPPWPYHSPKAVVGNGGRGSQNGRAATITQANVEQHYSTMSIDNLKKLDVASLAADNSHLYLWTTNSFMVESHEIAKSWGFVPKTILTWVKVHQKDPCRASMKTGYWYRSATEHIVFAVRGKQRLLGEKASPTGFMLPRLPHSVKPDYFYELIEKESPGPYLELFACNHRLNWEVWGNEVSSTVDLMKKA